MALQDRFYAEDNTRLTPEAVSQLAANPQKVYAELLRAMTEIFDAGTNNVSSGLPAWLDTTGTGPAPVSPIGDRAAGAVLGIFPNFGGGANFIVYFSDNSMQLAWQPTASVLIAPSDATLPRIDSIFLLPKERNIDGVVDVIDPVTRDVSSQTRVVGKTTKLPNAAGVGFGSDNDPSIFVIVTGTPASVPTAPAPPSGFFEANRIFDVRVNPGSGSINIGDVTDHRRVLRFRTELLPSFGDLIASQIGVVAPLGDAHVQAALERLDGVLAGFQTNRGLSHHGGLVWTSTGQVTLRRGTGVGAVNRELAFEINGTVVKKTDADLVIDMAVHLDGSEAASTWYYVYLENVGGALVPHISASPPVLPGSVSGKVGYHPVNTNWRFLAPMDNPAEGVLYNDGSSNLVPWTEVGSEWHLRDAPPSAFSQSLGTGQPTVYTAIALAGLFPAVASEVLVVVSAGGRTAVFDFGSGALIGQTVSSNRSRRSLTLGSNSDKPTGADLMTWLAPNSSGQVSYGVASSGSITLAPQITVIGWR